MIRNLIAVPYEVARLPLLVVDKTLSDKVSETFGPRLVVDRALGSADKVAGTLLGNRTITQRGEDRIERAQKLMKASNLERKADTRRQQARSTDTSARKEAAKKRDAAQDRVVSGLQEADAAEARGKQQASATAATTASKKKAAADPRAENRSDAVEKRESRVESAAEAKKKSAQRKAKSELQEARENKQSAAASRSDAERLEDLADAKKQERKQG
jgi:hypothetical protein